tara:strand:- start:26 stop:283 length:258 start_codon:yes stop_codon:yes gene_type:complete
MAESHEFKVIDDIFKRRYTLQKILATEVAVLDLEIVKLPENHPDYVEWEYEYKEHRKNLEVLYKKYEDLGGTYDRQEIKGVVNNS